MNPIIKEIFIYDNTKDAKSLIIFFYNKINSIFADKDIKESLLLFFAFIITNIEGKMPLPFKQCFLNVNLFDNNFDESFEQNEIEKGDKYLEDNLTYLTNNYYLNNLVFPEEDL